MSSVPLRAATHGPHRVVITGLGVISALGHNATEFWDALVGCQTGIRPLRSSLNRIEAAPLRFEHVAEVQGFEPEKYFDPRELSFMDRFAQFAVMPAMEAIRQSGIEWTPELQERTAVITGSCMGGRGAEENGYWELFHNHRTRVHPLTIPLGMSNAGTSHITMRWGLQGPAYTISTACASSGHAIGQAFHLVRSGVAPMAIAGGSEAPLFLGGMKAWEAMRVISRDTCRPFSADRSGLIVGEGGAILVLEPLEAALARGATPLAEIVGFGATADAGHITQPTATGPARAMQHALADAGIVPEQVGYINAHGTATEANDRTETAAIRTVFGAHADAVAVSSSKSMHGHTLGAAGALEAVATILALRSGMLPPTANYTKPDPACNLDVIPNAAREQAVEYALSNSFAFGGLNAVLAFKAWQ
ncbi:beta-ketoacyl synthase [Acidipila sp. EB88]|uniref:beta-ketoacyl-[acyl-carrier-protein] synthase family protein n=1 Tax=Acidipila sp. EB88 TaxID=2305226 RepID=UPI000F5F9071|nr:beta-ketoacyl-[acyl-carrier-protein] synthase family protein [Acidipila sp. EB88]RRA47765.1 beta-ketoacyl-[acyl-carrier-protein] synthase family protein [Acidipila sp. EB88]